MLTVWDKLRLQGMGAVWGRALVAPSWPRQQKPAVGSWAHLSASADNAGAQPWWSVGDTGARPRRQRCLCGEDVLSLRELKLGQVSWDSVNARVLLCFSPCLGHLVPSPFRCHGLLGVLVSCVALLYAQLLLFHTRTVTPCRSVSFFPLGCGGLFRLQCPHRVLHFLSCAALVCPPSSPTVPQGEDSWCPGTQAVVYVEIKLEQACRVILRHVYV